jgi:hypothetical protein
MTGANGGADTGAQPGWRWEVALSFAAAQRDYVEQVAWALKARGVRCFYDADEEIDLWGKYLAEELPAIYGERAAAVVVFVSAEYAARDWTRLERRAALNRAVRERGEYVLPARFDDTPLPGLLSDMVAVDLRGRIPEHFAAMITAKLAALGVTAPGSAGSPASDAGMARPPGAVRAGEADLRRLGVHVPVVPDEVPPEYFVQIEVVDGGTQTLLLQSNWRWCDKCQGLFFGGGQAESNCPGGGTHADPAQSGSGNYSLPHQAPPSPSRQSEWRWCNKCQGLFYGPAATMSSCPAGGTHSPQAQSGSGNYSLPHNMPPRLDSQSDWRWCNKCQGLFFGGGQAESNCPGGGMHADPAQSGSGNYSLPHQAA